jgi:hypothetical protein
VPPPPSDAGGIASPDPLRWIDGATVARLIGRAVGDPEAVADAETEGVRFRAADGATVEIRSLREDQLDRYGGDPSRWIDARTAAAAHRETIDDLGDYTVTTAGEGVVACYSWCTDACFVVSVSGAEGLDAVPEAVIRILYDWPA